MLRPFLPRHLLAMVVALSMSGSVLAGSANRARRSTNRAGRFIRQALDGITRATSACRSQRRIRKCHCRVAIDGARRISGPS
jgi:hypothetical protein